MCEYIVEHGRGAEPARGDGSGGGTLSESVLVRVCSDVCSAAVLISHASAAVFVEVGGFCKGYWSLCGVA